MMPNNLDESAAHWDYERAIETVDYHTAGEPFRIVTAGQPPIPGATVAERRVAAMESAEVQEVRRTLCHEPRGHADMYGCFVTPPDDDGADFGVLFWHKDGFSTACGHGTIAAARWAVESGKVPSVADGATEVRIDVPSGRVQATVRQTAGRIVDVTFRNVPSFVLRRAVDVTTSRGTIQADISYGGAFYASVRAADCGYRIHPDNVTELIAISREIKRAIDQKDLAAHLTDPRLSGCYGVMIFEDAADSEALSSNTVDAETADSGATDNRAAAHRVSGTGLETEKPAVHQRSITVFADGEVDRSPCGSGTGARVALLHADGALPPGADFVHDSIIGTRFTSRVVSALHNYDGAPNGEAVIVDVTGTAYPTGAHSFTRDRDDDLGSGFVLR